MAMLYNLVTMDELVVAFHNTETKEQSKQWLAKAQPGPVKAEVQATGRAD
jgi:hypothetical protein